VIKDTLDSLRHIIRDPVDDSGWVVTNAHVYFVPWSANAITYQPPETSITTKSVANGYSYYWNYVFDTANPEIILDSTKDSTVKYDIVNDTQTTLAVHDTGDTMYKNARVDDSLEFFNLSDDTVYYPHLDQDGFYVVDTIVRPNLYHRTSIEFEPINKRGLQTASDTIPNRIFSMEVHNSIKYIGGEVISLESDDDGWIFINDHLALDNGGPHAKKTKILFLDSLHLTKNHDYTFDCFFRDVGGDAVFNLLTDVQFNTKSAGTKRILGVRRSLRSTARGQMISIGIGKGYSMAIPQATANARFEVFSLDGREILQYKMNGLDRHAGIDIASRLHTGAYSVRAECRNGEGAALGSVVRKLIIK